jgi:hypothetical protein
MKARLLLLVSVLAAGYLTVTLAGCARPIAPAADEGPGAVRVARGQQSESEPGAFVFPSDRGGELLAELLPPAHRDPPRPARGSVRSPHAAPPRGLEHPEVAAAAGLPSLPRARLDSRPAVSRPRPLLDEPLPNEPGLRGLPEEPVVPPGQRLRLPSPDAALPVPLPLFAQPQPDRASFDDPTNAAAAAAALVETPPPRTAPAPFLRLSLPEPFENRRTVRTATPLPDEAMPAPAVPRLPRP